MKAICVIFVLITANFATGTGNTNKQNLLFENFGQRLNRLLNSDLDTSLDGLNLNAFIQEAAKRKALTIKSIPQNLISSHTTLDPFEAYTEHGSRYCDQVESAANFGHVESQYGLGLCNLMNWIPEANLNSAYQWFCKASQLQHNEALFFKALIELEYFYKNNPSRTKLAFKAIENSRALKSKYAQIYTSFIKLINGGKAKRHLAYRRLRKEALKNQPLASYVMGLSYMKSLGGIPYSPQKAKTYLKSALNKGYSPASSMIKIIESNQLSHSMPEKFYSILNTSQTLDMEVNEYKPSSATNALLKGDLLELDPVIACQISCWWRDLAKDKVATKRCFDCKKFNLVKQASPKANIPWDTPKKHDLWLNSEKIEGIERFAKPLGDDELDKSLKSYLHKQSSLRKLRTIEP